jgi:hypothetical protein
MSTTTAQQRTDELAAKVAASQALDPAEARELLATLAAVARDRNAWRDVAGDLWAAADGIPAPDADGEGAWWYAWVKLAIGRYEAHEAAFQEAHAAGLAAPAHAETIA